MPSLDFIKKALKEAHDKTNSIFNQTTKSYFFWQPTITSNNETSQAQTLQSNVSQSSYTPRSSSNGNQKEPDGKKNDQDSDTSFIILDDSNSDVHEAIKAEPLEFSDQDLFTPVEKEKRNESKKVSLFDYHPLDHLLNESDNDNEASFDSSHSSSQTNQAKSKFFRKRSKQRKKSSSKGDDQLTSGDEMSLSRKSKRIENNYLNYINKKYDDYLYYNIYDNQRLAVESTDPVLNQEKEKSLQTEQNKQTEEENQQINDNARQENPEDGKTNEIGPNKHHHHHKHTHRNSIKTAKRLFRMKFMLDKALTSLKNASCKNIRKEVLALVENENTKQDDEDESHAKLPNTEYVNLKLKNPDRNVSLLFEVFTSKWDNADAKLVESVMGSILNMMKPFESIKTSWELKFDHDNELSIRVLSSLKQSEAGTDFLISDFEIEKPILVQITDYKIVNGS